MPQQSLLVVESPDDEHALYALLKRRKFSPEFPIEAQGGYETLIKRLAARLVPGSDLQQLGIVVDADQDCRARWEAIRDRLRKEEYKGVPEDPDPAGVVLDHLDRPRVGVWIMPNNSLPGMLEDFLAYLVPNDDRLWPRSIKSVDEIPEVERLFGKTGRSKASIYTWLAWQEEPGKPLGQAITKNLLRSEGLVVDLLMDWLGRLFA